MKDSLPPATTGYRIPTVLESDGRIERAWDIYSLLLKDRVIFLDEQFHDGLASSICAQLLYLDNKEPGKPISIYITSPGGVVTSGLAIYDTMQFIKSPVATICMGMAASMGSFILMAGTKGRRYALPNAQIMTHQPSGGFQGQATDIEIHAKQTLFIKKRLIALYAKHCGGKPEDWEKLLERDRFFTPEEALEWGMIDEIITQAP